MMNMLHVKTPVEIVKQLDKHIIGQNSAKRAVAVALRNRYRRKFVSSDMRNEITPKNILMIGATGVGKTEIARRLAKLDNSPFIKVEATKFTEIGYVGRDVESIVRDLVDIAIKLVKDEEVFKIKFKVDAIVEDKILDILLSKDDNYSFEDKKKDSSVRKLFREKLKSGELDKKYIDIEVTNIGSGIDIMSPPGMEEMTGQLKSILQSLSPGKKKNKRVRIIDAIDILKDEEGLKLINEEDIKSKAIKKVEENGIVFLDEIDKIMQGKSNKSNADISREGVQRDLLPLIEGCSVVTKYGVVKTDYILFIAAGAFHISNPSDLIPELQGRLPIRVELKSLTVKDFIRILIEPDASLIKQYKCLLKVEGINLKFSDNSISCIAEIAYNMNEYMENIGARRLHTVMEKLLEDVLFISNNEGISEYNIDSEYVNNKLAIINKHYDLKKFIL